MWSVIINLWVVLFLCLSYHYGGATARLLTLDEDQEFKKPLNSLHGPSVEFFQDEAGDIYDCVDIEKQPAFDHPLLKNHKIRMMPTYPDEVLNNTASAHERPKGIGCPYGKVPIRRTQKDDLIRVKSFLASYSTPDSLRTTYAGRHIAVLRSKNTTRLYKGVEGNFNILSPNAVSGQHSSGQLWVEGGPQNTFNSIQAGWAISPLSFGDEKTRAFIYWQGEGNIKGCFNLQCPGYVQVNKDYAVDRVLPASQFDKEQNEFALGIIQDVGTKDWWLVNTHFSIRYGYWPKELFPHLQSGSNQVGWGGLTYADKDYSSPPMGTGYFPDGHFKRGGSVLLIQVVDDRAGYKRSPDQDFLETFTDAPSCYAVKDYGYTHESGYTIMYGGPGGTC